MLLKVTATDAHGDYTEMFLNCKIIAIQGKRSTVEVNDQVVRVPTGSLYRDQNEQVIKAA